VGFRGSQGRGGASKHLCVALKSWEPTFKYFHTKRFCGNRLSPDELTVAPFGSDSKPQGIQVGREERKKERKSGGAVSLQCVRSLQAHYAPVRSCAASSLRSSAFARCRGLRAAEGGACEDWRPFGGWEPTFKFFHTKKFCGNRLSPNELSFAHAPPGPTPQGIQVGSEATHWCRTGQRFSGSQ